MKKNLALYFGSMSLSLLGNGVASVLFPLLVLMRTGDIGAAGLLAGITAAVGVASGLLGGVVADRVNRRNLSAFADLLSAASVAVLAIVDLSGGLTMPVLIGLAVVGAVIDIPGMTARETMLPQVAKGTGVSLDRLVAVRETLVGVIILVGPAAGGVLVAVLGVDARVLFVTAILSILAALLTILMPKVTGQIEERSDGSTVQQMAEGLKYVFANPVIRAATIVSTVIAAALTVLQTTLIPAYFVADGAAALSGYVLSSVAFGTVVGGLSYVAVAPKLSRRVWLISGVLGTGLMVAALGSLPGALLIFVFAFLLGVVSSPASAVLGVVTIDVTKPELLGRVLGVQNSVLLVGPALLAGPLGLMAEKWGLRPVGILLGVLVTIAALWATLGKSFRTIGSEQEADDGMEHPAAS